MLSFLQCMLLVSVKYQMVVAMCTAICANNAPCKSSNLSNENLRAGHEKPQSELLIRVVPETLKRALDTPFAL